MWSSKRKEKMKSGSCKSGGSGGQKVSKKAAKSGATVFLLLLLCNDVEQNPGPINSSAESKRQDRLENFVK